MDCACADVNITSKLIDWVNFCKKFNYPFLHMSIFGIMFPENHSFVSVPVTRSNNFVSLH